MGGVIPPQDYDSLKRAGVACVFGPGETIPVDPLCGVGAGVTTIVDAGSAVSGDIDRLADEVVSPTASDIYVLLTNHAWPDGYTASVRASKWR